MVQDQDTNVFFAMMVCFTVNNVICGNLLHDRFLQVLMQSGAMLLVKSDTSLADNAT